MVLRVYHCGLDNVSTVLVKFEIIADSAVFLRYGTLKMESQWSWKTPSILQAFPSVIQLFLIWLVYV